MHVYVRFGYVSAFHCGNYVFNLPPRVFGRKNNICTRFHSLVCAISFGTKHVHGARQHESVKSEVCSEQVCDYGGAIQQRGAFEGQSQETRDVRS